MKIQYTRVFKSDNDRRELRIEEIPDYLAPARIAEIAAHTAENPYNSKFHTWFNTGIQTIS